MRFSFSKLTAVAVLLASGATLSYAQTATTGAFQGVVSDTSGAPLAGAIIRMTSFQITRTATTDAEGKFHAGLMNAGTWQVTVTKGGYTSGTQSVILGINESRVLNFKLPKEGGATVEVVGTASIVDANSTTTGLNVSIDELSAIPAGRTANELAFLSPGVASGGTTFGSSVPGLGLSINGASGAENSFIVDGLVTNDFRYGGTATNLPMDFIESIDVQTGGYKPEFSALGGVFSVVTKSGSNDFRGSAWTSFEPLSMQAVNKKNDYFNQAALFAGPPVRDPINNGDSAARERTEIGATAGGAFIKDKLFYFVGLNSIGSKSDPFTNFSNVEVGQRKETDTSVTAKVNYFLNTDQQLTFSYFGNTVTDDAPNDRTAQFGDADTSFKHTITSNNYSLVYDWTIQSNLVLSVKGGLAKIHDTVDLGNPDLPQILDSHWFNGGGGGTGSYLQQKNPYTRGGFGRYNPNEEGKTTQFKADLSWILGSHSLKFGASTLESDYHRTAATSGGGWYIIRAAGDRIDKRWQTDDSTVKAEFQAFYVQDTWDLTPNLKIFYGVRYETQAQKDPNGVTFMKFDNFSDYTQPRIGFTWDPEKDGKTKVSGSFARYFEQIPQRLAARVYGHEVYMRNRYTNGSGNQTFVYSSTGVGTYSGTPSVTDFATPYSRDPIAEGTKLPRRTEYTLGYERTIQEGLTVGIHGKHRTMDNILEDSTIRGPLGDPGTNYAYDLQERAILWNPGRNVSWTDQDGKHYSNVPTYFDPAKNIYDSLDFTLVKQTKRSYLSFSYTWSRSEGNYEGLVTSSNGQADSSITASFDEWPYVGYGPLPLDRTHIAKLFASRNWDLGPGIFTFGINWSYQTGTPISRFDDGSSSNPPLPDVGGYGNATPENMILGQYGRTPATNNIDLKLDYSWDIVPKVKVSPTVDVYNLANSRMATRVLQQATDSGGNPDPRYGYATDWQRGRRVRFGLKVTF
ncbi:MAG TPA: TonB-dependent receptor [Geothrix sp.]|nr:TonB-dependent receptor [Geothrix sp.]